MTNYPPLKPLHSSASLSPVKLAELGRLSREAIKQTLLPGGTHSLKARSDGTLLEVHHRIRILRNRGIDVDSMPREIIPGNE